jgi:hypothetical protein
MYITRVTGYRAVCHKRGLYQKEDRYIGRQTDTLEASSILAWNKVDGAYVTIVLLLLQLLILMKVGFYTSPHLRNR